MSSSANAHARLALKPQQQEFVKHIHNSFLGTLSLWPCFPLPAPVFCRKQRVAGSDNGRNIKEDNDNNEDGGKTTTFDSAAPAAT